MFLHKTAPERDAAGRLVKFGYIVFTAEEDARRAVRKGVVRLCDGGMVRLAEMAK